MARIKPRGLFSFAFHVSLLFLSSPLSCLAVLIAACCSENQQPPAPLPPPPINRIGPVVDLNYSAYEGLRLPNGVNAFLGLRYAAPPLGQLRWRAPAEPPRTQQLQQAKQFQPVCLGIGTAYPDPGHDEDCLFANVWAPTDAGRHSKLPVWVFIPGGGYVSLTNANWNGAEVVEKSGHSIVFVNFNYRVGLWGFLASERVRADGDLNTGLLDQRMLMTWVKTHIASFGGDPDHVVIHGASAGAGSVALHMVAYGGRNDGLFVGAMAESLFFPAQPFVAELEYQFDRVADQTGCSTTTEQISCLRGQDAAVLQAANHAQPFPGRSEPPSPLFYFTPCIDGSFLYDLPYRLFRAGRFVRGIPFLSGTTTDEGTVFATDASSPADVARFLANNYPRLTPNDTAAVLARYPPQQLPALPRHRPWFPTASRAYGEATFVCPSVNVLDTLLHHTITTTPGLLFSYRYDVLDDENVAAGLGVPHIFEAAAVFGPDNIGPPGAARASYRTYNAAVVPLLMAYWLSFVRALDPSPHRLPGSPAWGPWTTSGGDGETRSRLLLETGGRASMEVVPTDELDRCAFWLRLGDTLEQKKKR
ncbi:Alpha/Beta hydrolase protein [Lasiosphaeria miniovina]|uniref:Carboxylic ester hydrolase n=1 Tax=Lasiosphaeria miniovina TaxID=1954250 RepID=A0AA40EG03_9PEZI|nr:Alpha/Beta hydrolase protein [Lasiosphaeria miniovina]KAK0733863.1 Alpha/Beta hydrolase protein [Lasiosphaeria miniovina]